MRMNRNRGAAGPRRQSGFSMIEVLVAVLVLALGLLGFALLQTMNLRFTQSANHRTQAVNLASDLLDQMRSNRNDSAWYAATASFAAESIDVERCSRPTGEVDYIDNIERWQCQVVATLGPAASVEAAYEDGVVDIAIDWGGERWNEDAAEGASLYRVETRL